MKHKYTKSQFGRCTRYHCEKAAMLPIGLSDDPHIEPVRLYCPRCKELYVPHLSISSKYITIDGAYFGTSFPHMFFMVYPDARPPEPKYHFVASLYGFKIHPNAYEYQHVQSAKMAKTCPMQINASKYSSTNININNNNQAGGSNNNNNRGRRSGGVGGDQPSSSSITCNVSTKVL